MIKSSGYAGKGGTPQRGIVHRSTAACNARRSTPLANRKVVVSRLTVTLQALHRMSQRCRGKMTAAHTPFLSCRGSRPRCQASRLIITQYVFCTGWTVVSFPSIFKWRLPGAAIAALPFPSSSTKVTKPCFLCFRVHGSFQPRAPPTKAPTELRTREGIAALRPIFELPSSRPLHPSSSSRRAVTSHRRQARRTRR